MVPSIRRRGRKLNHQTTGDFVDRFTHTGSVAGNEHGKIDFGSEVDHDFPAAVVALVEEDAARVA